MGEQLQLLIVQIGVILIVGRATGLLLRALGQPQVVGEMVGGILLGPSVLGAFDNGVWMNALFPKDSISYLQMLSQLGVMLFMFLIGLELDPRRIRGQGRAVAITGVASILGPFALGVIVAVVMGAMKIIPGQVSSRTAFVLFMGTAMSITAFPVLARILAERNMTKTKVGSVALACAAMNDAIGWCILALVVAITAKHAGDSAALTVLAPLSSAAMALTYVAGMVLFARRALARLQRAFETRGYLSPNLLAVVFLMLLGSAYLTDRIGIHALFGAFMLGAVMPAEERFVKHLSEKLEDLTVLFLLPTFFAFTGLKTQIGLIHGGQMWLICGALTLVAIVGKMGITFLAGGISGLGLRQAATLGVLMNTRGLMELIILNIGLELRAISPELFAMMVVMTLVTTFMTTPLLALIYPRKVARKDAALLAPAHLSGMSVLAAVAKAESAPGLVRLAALLVGPEAGRVVAIHLERADEDYPAGEDPVVAAVSVAREVRIPIATERFFSRDVADDLCEAATRHGAQWLVMGWHKPVFIGSILGGNVARVLREAAPHVAIFVDKGLGEVRRVLIPYMGDPQDVGALAAVDRLARLPDVHVTILHVVKPGRGGEERLGVGALVDRHITSAGASEQVHVQIIESESPIDVVTAESHRYDLMVLGLSPRWHLEAGILGAKEESVAQLSACSLLIVRGGRVATPQRAVATTPAR